MKIYPTNIFLFIFFLLFLSINIITALGYPYPWIDEILYIDAGMNLAEGNGFTSSAWGSQGKNEFWASNTPLYPLIQGLWIKIFGSDLTTIRSFYYLLGLLSSILIAKGLENFDLVKSSKLRFNFIIFFLMLFPIAYTYRLGRPDILCLFLASSIYASISYKESIKRNSALIISSTLVPMASLALVFFVFTIILCSLLFFGKKAIKDSALIIVSLFLGIILMLIFYWINGGLESFLMTTVGSGHTLLGQIAQYFVFGDERVIGKILDFPIMYFESFTTWPITSILLISSYTLLLSRKTNRNKVNYFFISIILGVPFVLAFVGEYHWLYRWMHFSILTIGIFYSIDKLNFQENRFILIASTSILSLVSIIGLPWIIMTAYNEMGTKNIDNAKYFIEKNISNTESVVIDPFFYFQTKKLADQIFVITYGGGRGLKIIPDAEKYSVSKMIIKKSDFSKMQSKYGGEWTIIDSFSLDKKEEGFFDKKINALGMIWVFNDRFAGISGEWDTLYLYQRVK